MELLLIVFTTGYLIQHIASFLLIRKIRKQRHIEGLSLDTQIIFLIGSIIRCVWIFDTRLTRLPLAWAELFISVTACSYIVYLFRKYKETQYNAVKNPFDVRLIIIACIILSFIFHPGSKNKYYLSIQMLVSLSMYLEACGLLPQIFIIRKVGECEVMTGHYLICLGLSRLLRLGFWVMMYLQGDTFLYLVIADLLHTILLLDFVYYYIKNRNSPIILLR